METYGKFSYFQIQILKELKRSNITSFLMDQYTNTPLQLFSPGVFPPGESSLANFQQGEFPPGDFLSRELHHRKFHPGKKIDRNYELTEMISIYNYVLLLQMESF